MQKENIWDWVKKDLFHKQTSVWYQTKQDFSHSQYSVCFHPFFIWVQKMLPGVKVSSKQNLQQFSVLYAQYIEGIQRVVRKCFPKSALLLFHFVFLRVAQQISHDVGISWSL